jgi:hypothetical protein
MRARAVDVYSPRLREAIEPSKRHRHVRSVTLVFYPPRGSVWRGILALDESEIRNRSRADNALRARARMLAPPPFLPPPPSLSLSVAMRPLETGTMSAIILQSSFTVTPANARRYSVQRQRLPADRRHPLCAGHVCLLIDRLEPSTGAITTVTTRYRQRDQVGHVRTASERFVAATRAGPENKRVPRQAVCLAPPPLPLPPPFSCCLSSVYSMPGKSEPTTTTTTTTVAARDCRPMSRAIGSARGGSAGFR